MKLEIKPLFTLNLYCYYVKLRKNDWLPVVYNSKNGIMESREKDIQDGYEVTKIHVYENKHEL